MQEPSPEIIHLDSESETEYAPMLHTMPDTGINPPDDQDDINTLPRSMSEDDRTSLFSETEPIPAEWDDAVLEEIRRALFGFDDTTLDVRPPTPPSPPPPRSPSSLDWENENFRPPTPPRRRMLGSFDIRDRQYRHLGWRCYERVWTARILVPETRPQAGIEYFPPSDTTPPRGEEDPNDRSVPTTPGKGWLKWFVEDDNRTSVPEIVGTGYAKDLRTPSRETSPAPSPPALSLPLSLSPSSLSSLSPTASSPTTYSPSLSGSTSPSSSSRSASPPTAPPPASQPPYPREIPLREAPTEIQQEVHDKIKATQAPQAVRLLRVIEGHRYRVLIARNGHVRIVQLNP